MSQIDKLIADLCPNGIEFRTLGDIARLVRGNGMPKSDLTENGVGAIHYGQIYTRYGAWARATISFVSEATATKLAKVDPGDIVITNTSENIEDVGKAVAWLGDEQIVTGGHATVIKHAQDPKYLSYWFQSRAFFDQKRALATGTKVIDVSARQLEKVRIPVPPLEVQREIVRVLDKFTQLEAELKAELEARHRQYEHYRNHLLTFNKPKVPWVSIGSICSQVISGGTPLVTRREYYGGQIPWLRTQEVRYSDIYETETSITDTGLANSSARWIPKNSVIIAISGAGVTRGRAAVNKIPLTTNQHCCSLILDPTKAHYRFVYHYIRSQYEELRSRGQGNRSDLTVEIIKAFLIPLPLLGEQKQIASVLDKFDSLVNDLSIGLPAELAARRKQYEYYRDRLLTFEEKR